MERNWLTFGWFVANMTHVYIVYLHAYVQVYILQTHIFVTR